MIRVSGKVVDSLALLGPSATHDTPKLGAFPVMFTNSPRPQKLCADPIGWLFLLPQPMLSAWRSVLVLVVVQALNLVASGYNESCCSESRPISVSPNRVVDKVDIDLSYSRDGINRWNSYRVTEEIDREPLSFM